jgi:hypothetical protein
MIRVSVPVGSLCPRRIVNCSITSALSNDVVCDVKEPAFAMICIGEQTVSCQQGTPRALVFADVSGFVDAMSFATETDIMDKP